MSVYDDLFASDENYNLKSDYKMTMVETWIEQNGLKKILDVGCGRGHYLEFLKRFDVTGLEPSKYLCDHDLKQHKVINSDILGFKTNKKWDGLYCMDVLEHISHAEIDATLEALSKLAPKALLGIANHSDIQNGVELHPIQENAEWWGHLLKKHYKVVNLTYEPPRYFVFEVSN